MPTQHRAMSLKQFLAIQDPDTLSSLTYPPVTTPNTTGGAGEVPSPIVSTLLSRWETAARNWLHTGLPDAWETMARTEAALHRHDAMLARRPK